jgi:TonB family protein
MSIGLIVLLALMAPQRVRMAEATDNSLYVITAPEIAAYTDPFYTRTARDNRIEGTVTVEAAFDEKGRVTVLRTVKGLGYGLDENAVAALRQWTFCPALRDETPMAAVAQIDIDFKLANLPPREFDDTKHVAGNISAPVVVKRIEPQYTDAARKARIGGTAVLQTVVKTDGTAKVLKIVRPLPYGLTESAIHALEQWTFTPAMENGKAIPVSMLAEIVFNLEQQTSNLVRPACASAGPGR